MTVGDGSFLSAHASATTHPMSVQPKKMLFSTDEPQEVAATLDNYPAKKLPK